MSKCINCGSENPDNSIFCLECGKPLIPVPELAVDLRRHPVRLTLSDFAEEGQISDTGVKTSRKPAIAAIAALAVFLAAGIFAFSYDALDKGYSGRSSDEDEQDLTVISDAQVRGVSDCIYTGEEITPDIEVWLAGKKLSEGEDYILVGVDDVFPGQAYLMVFGTGDFEGEIYCDYMIKLDDEVCDDPDNERVVEFVNRFYESVYFRNGSRDEIVSWVNRLCEGSADGSDIAVEFFTSAELSARELSDEEFVCLIYRVLLSRKAEPEGLQAWCNVLARGSSRGDVVAMLASSNEFGNLCSMYGIEANI